ncbi:MAG: hypothetical protein ABH860_01430 [bacterium]
MKVPGKHYFFGISSQLPPKLVGQLKLANVKPLCVFPPGQAKRFLKSALDGGFGGKIMLIGGLARNHLLGNHELPKVVCKDLDYLIIRKSTDDNSAVILEDIKQLHDHLKTSRFWKKNERTNLISFEDRPLDYLGAIDPNGGRVYHQPPGKEIAIFSREGISLNIDSMGLVPFNDKKDDYIGIYDPLNVVSGVDRKIVEVLPSNEAEVIGLIASQVSRLNFLIEYLSNSALQALDKNFTLSESFIKAFLYVYTFIKIASVNEEGFHHAAGLAESGLITRSGRLTELCGLITQSMRTDKSSLPKPLYSSAVKDFCYPSIPQAETIRYINTLLTS